MNEPDIIYLPSSVYEKRLSGRVKHTLYEVNLERKTAFCTACGYTEIHVAKSRIREKPKVFCIKRFRELNEDAIEKRLLRPVRKLRHSLSEVDPEKRTANCSVCGRTDVWIRHVHGSIVYLCGRYYRTEERKDKRARRVSRATSPRVHILSEIDEDNKLAVCSLCGPVPIYMWQGKRKIIRRCSNASVARIPQARKIRRKLNTDLISRYKVDHGCERCGYTSNPDRLLLHTKNPEKNDPKIEDLFQLAIQELMQELDSCEVLCANCYRLAYQKSSSSEQST